MSELQIKEKDFEEVELTKPEVIEKNRLVIDDLKSPIKENQLMGILQKTPKKYIQERPGKGGGKFEFVSGTYIKKVLNYVFGFDGTFEIKDREKTNDQVIVLGRLKVNIYDERINQVREIIKEQFGRADIKRYTKGDKKGQIMDIGNDGKAAATDALKKCASEFGVASDVYGRKEFRDIVAEIKQQDAKKENELELARTYLKEAENLEELKERGKKVDDTLKAQLSDEVEELKAKYEKV